MLEVVEARQDLQRKAEEVAAHNLGEVGVVGVLHLEVGEEEGGVECLHGQGQEEEVEEGEDSRRVGEEAVVGVEVFDPQVGVVLQLQLGLQAPENRRQKSQWQFTSWVKFPLVDVNLKYSNKTKSTCSAISDLSSSF